MPDGDSPRLSGVGDGGDGAESSTRVQKTEKDPIKIARKYQLDLCKKAMEENIIVYLGTGCGKTHIAVLLINELGHLIRKPQKNICVFLAPTVALVHQQARVIEESLDFKVGTFCGSSKPLKNHHDWEKEIDQYEVLVMIPEILLMSLYHRSIKMELIALLIFDECHHAQVNSNHPYAQIMKDFYKPDTTKVPRIFGMTASPVVGKGASNQANLPKSINSLESILDAKVCSVDTRDLKYFVASPVMRVYQYGPVSNSTSSTFMTFSKKLAEIRRECISAISRETNDHQSLRNTKKQLNRLHENMIFCLENLGLWGALQASQILLSGDRSERSVLIEVEGNSFDDSLCRFVVKAVELFAADCTRDGIAPDLSSVEDLKEPFFSQKILRLIGILSTFRLQPNMKCIIFVNRIITARSLSYILQKLKFLASWKCHFLVGVHAGLKSMSRKTMKNILEKFRSGELNLLVATKVGEEGLDIQTCCLVIRFDLPETVSSFIQSRGRARMPQSEYAFLVDSGNQKELDLIEIFGRDENRMNMEIATRTSNETFTATEERLFTVDSSGACSSAGYSISLLHRYCSKLPHDEFFNPKPKFYYFDDLGGIVCNLSLPSNAPIYQIVGTPQSSREAAKKEACLKAIEELHNLGALDEYLLTEQKNANEEELELESPDFDSYEGEDSRADLHEMLVPAALRGSWKESESPICLNSYYIHFIPDPPDRIYKEFGLFVKSPLPGEAEKMELDLHLAHGRSVTTKLVPSGVMEFTKDKVIQAQNFQEMSFRAILDRSDFIYELVPLGKDDYRELHSSTYYLLLPVKFHKYANTVTVDWKLVGRCLSSPIFRTPGSSVDRKKFPSHMLLQLDNGCSSINDVENSLVYAPHQNLFYFVTNIVREKNSHCRYKDLEATSYVDHLSEKYDIHLKYPEQPLLRAKPVFHLHNLLHNRKHEDSESHELDEYFCDLPPEICQLKIIGFSKDIGSSLSLLPSIMHRLENLLVAIELKRVLSASFPEGAEVTADRVLEALTTEKCQERFSLERLEILGDAFLKYAVGRHFFLLHDTLDEGELTRKRSNAVNNSNLFKLAIRSNVQVFIRDQPFDPCQFFALGRRCPVICSKETKGTIHSQCTTDASEVRCSKGHHWLQRKTIADVVEALVGAFIVDSGFKAATAFLRWIGIPVDFEVSQVTNVCTASKSYLPLAAFRDMVALEKLLDYQFLHRGLLLQAFVHPSYTEHGGGCYQRLEFLGDAVLDYLIISYLFSVYPNLKPGHLTDLRSILANNKAIANVAVDRSFHKFIFFDSGGLKEAINNYVNFMNSSSARESSEGPKCPKALGDLVESCLGAILLDTGFNLETVWKVMLSFLDPIMSFSSFQLSPLRELQELCQCHGLNLQFPTLKTGGKYLVEAKVMKDNDVCLSASVTNLSKKDAVRIASELLFPRLKAEGYMPKSKPLKDVLKSSDKKEARLIGYDETPVDFVVPDSTEFGKLKVAEPSSSTNSDSDSEATSSNSSPPINRRSSFPFKDIIGQSRKNIADPSDIESQTSGGSQNKSARSRLYEICAANCWKPPLFECCEEEGPSHLKLFIFRAILEIESSQDIVLECFGTPQAKKKAAAEQAAEAALWYLEREGYLP